MLLFWHRSTWQMITWFQCSAVCLCVWGGGVFGHLLKSSYQFTKRSQSSNKSHGSGSAVWGLSFSSSHVQSSHATCWTPLTCLSPRGTKACFAVPGRVKSVDLETAERALCARSGCHAPSSTSVLNLGVGGKKPSSGEFARLILKKCPSLEVLEMLWGQVFLFCPSLAQY